MLLKDKKEQHITYYERSDELTDETVKETADLLFELMDAASVYAGNHLEVEVNRTKKTIHDLYWDCKCQLDQILTSDDKASFLTMNVLEQTYKLAKPLLACPLTELLNGSCSMVEWAKRLESILAENPWKKLWQDKADAYKNTLAYLGFQTDALDFSDLTKIIDPLLNALTAYRKPNILQIRKGAGPKHNRPDIAKDIAIYSSEKELVDTVMSVNRECAIVFGAVQKTNAQVKDYFHEWFYDCPEERQRNFMQHDKITKEQYLSQIAEYTRQVYVCIKKGENGYLMHLPWNSGNYRQVSAETEYYYGKRASYAPYGIFYKTLPSPSIKEKGALWIPRTSHPLADLMDELSAAWLPVFLDETIRYFFGEKDLSFEQTFLPEEVTAEPSSEDAEEKPAYTIVPVHTGMPVKSTSCYEIKEPKWYFPQDIRWIYNLFDQFHITTKDLEGIPLLPEKPCYQTNLRETVETRIKQAYLKILGKRIAEFLTCKWHARRMVTDYVMDNRYDILRRAGTGEFSEFLKVIINNAPVLDESGNPVLTKQDKYPYDQVPLVQKTSAYDAVWTTRKQAYSNMVPLCFHNPSYTGSGAPPVLWKIRPAKPEHFATLLQIPIEKLPTFFRIFDKLQLFYNTFRHELPNSMDRGRILYQDIDEQKPNIQVPDLADIHFCMGKKEHYSYPAFAGTKPKRKKKGEKPDGTD